MKVLVLEDNPEHREYLFEVFRSMGFTTLAAMTTEEALHLAATERPDLVVLDIMLRIGDGREAARQLKGSPLTSDIPILAVTGLAQREDCLAAGCDEFLRKPFRVHELGAVVQSLVDRRRAAAES